MEIYWTNQTNNVGNGYGYSMHAKMLQAACERAGVKSSPMAKIAVHIITGLKFRPVMKRINVLYSMYECTTLPDSWIPHIQKADLIVVPCKQNRDLFRNYTKVPIEVCWEGVDTEAFPYVERSRPLSKFVYLWVGAPNPRKGFTHVGAAWDAWGASGRMPRNVWLYCKSSGITGGEFVRDIQGTRTTVDTRNLSTEQLFGLYRDAHAFLLPSMGEGFGLTLAEAMSTGLPCVYTPWGGPRDFADESVAYPVKWEFSEVQAMLVGNDGTRKVEQNSYAAYPDVVDIVRRMEQIYSAYPAALAKGKRASERIRKGFTWDISAASFIDILQRHFGEGVKVA